MEGKCNKHTFLNSFLPVTFLPARPPAAWRFMSQTSSSSLSRSFGARYAVSDRAGFAVMRAGLAPVILRFSSPCLFSRRSLYPSPRVGHSCPVGAKRLFEASEAPSTVVQLISCSLEAATPSWHFRHHCDVHGSISDMCCTRQRGGSIGGLPKSRC